eukprot:4993626-Pyramimonas_sp.AAC.1
MASRTLNTMRCQSRTDFGNRAGPLSGRLVDPRVKRSPVARACPRQSLSPSGLVNSSVSSFMGYQNLLPLTSGRRAQSYSKIRGGQMIQAVFKKYTSARAMRIRVSKENPRFPYETYFQDAERVVKVTVSAPIGHTLVTPSVE